MLSAHIATQIYANFGFPPTESQKKVIFSLSEYLATSSQGDIFMLNGYAGTGKTTLMGALVGMFKTLGIKHVLMAPTGRAAKVLSLKCKSTAFTIHKKIYRQKSISSNGGFFELGFNKDNDTIYIVDEASMLSNAVGEGSAFGSGQLIEDLMAYIALGDNNRLILVGDDAQLPPVGLDFSPALNPLFMKQYGTVEYAELDQVVRQSESSGVLVNATEIRYAIDKNEIVLPHFDLSRNDVRRISGNDLIEAIEDSYAQVGRDDTIIITRSNKRSVRFNQGIRTSILGYEQEIESGDHLMVVKNNYYFTERDKECPIDFIANGDVAVVERIYHTREIYGFRFAYVKLRFGDYDDYSMECWIILDALYSESPSLSRLQQEQLFRTIEQDYLDEPNQRRRYAKIMENEFWGALQVKFAYSVTCHKAQGGQWGRVFLDTMLFGDEPMTRDFQRWLYTAITRATERLYLVNWEDSYFK